MIHSRPFENESDYEGMRRLLVESLGLTGLPVYATIGDIDWWRSSEEDPRAVYKTRLWFDDERPVAWAWPVDDQVDIIVHPGYPELHDTALVWAEEDYRQRHGEFPEKPMRAWGFGGDEVRNSILEKRGYRRTENGLVFYTRPIVPLSAPPSLPPGYSFDHVRGEADVARRAAVQREAFESEFMTEDKVRIMQTLPTYRPDLDLVIVAPDGTYAAFAQIWLDAANGVGVFEPLGVSARHQRRGLGRAILDEGVRRLGEQGARTACVQTGIDYQSARGLYEASGFTELDRDYAWVRDKNDDSPA